MGTIWEADPIAVGGTTTVRGRSGGGRRYRLLPFMQKLLDAIPSWLKWTLALIGAVFGLTVGQRIDPADAATIGALAVAGGVLGGIALPLIVVVADVSMQLTIVLIKLAIVVGIIAAVAYALGYL